MMHKTFISLAISYISGIAAFALWGNAVIGVFTYILLCIIIYLVFLNRKNLPVATLVISLFFLGLAQMHFAEKHHNKFLNSYANKYVTLCGRVTETSITAGGNIGAVIDVNEVLRNGKIYSANHKVKISTTVSLKQGDITAVSGILKPVDGALNEGGFDLNRYYRTKSISAYMYTDKIIITGNHLNIFDYLSSLRTTLGAKAEKVIGGDAGAFCNSLMFGDTSPLPPKLKNNFVVAGLSHVIAVSGTHLTILISFVIALLSYFGASRKLRSGVAIGAIIIYVCIVGFLPSVVRSAIMSLLMLAAIETDRKEDVFTSLLISAAVILFINPYSIYDVGFLLSFAATIGIVVFTKPLAEKLSAVFPAQVAQVIATTLAGTISTQPIISAIFGTLSVYSLIANLLVAPLVEIIFIGTFAVLALSYILPFVASGIGSVIYMVAYSLISITNLVAALPFSLLAVKSPGIADYAFIACVFVMVYRWLYKKKQYKTVIFAGSISLVAALTLSVLSMFNFTVHFINVGQGDSALICAPFGKNYVIDTGSSGIETANYITKLGINKLDAVFISHTDLDHCGGIRQLLETVSVDKVILPKTEQLSCDDGEILQYLRTIADKIEYAGSGSSYTFGDSSTSVLMPREMAKESSDNENSLVQKVTYKNFSLLFTGDIGADTEKKLLELYPYIRADVLKVSHHGSRYSSSEDFIKNLSPRFAVIGVSSSNGYGHPDAGVIDTLTKNNVKIYRTDENGNIVFTVKPNGKLYIKTKRGSAYEQT